MVEWEAADPDIGALRCPQCNSTRIEYPQLTRKFLTPAAGRQSFALKVFPKEFYCQDCHFTWTDEVEHPRYRFWNASFPVPEIQGLNPSALTAPAAARRDRTGHFVRPRHASLGHEMDLRFSSRGVIFGGAALFSYKIFIRPELVMRAEKRSRGHAVPNAGRQPAGVPGSAETKRGRQIDRGARRLDRLHPEIPQRPCTSAKRRICSATVNTSILLSELSGAGKRGIHRAQRRRAGADRGQDQNHAGTDHAHQQPEQHDAAYRAKASHLASGLFHPHPAQREACSTCSITGNSLSAIGCAKKNCRPMQPPKITTRVAEIMAWKNGKRIGFGSRKFPQQHALDSPRHAGIHPLFRARRFPSDPRNPAAGAGHWDERVRRRGVEQPCKHENGCHHC